MGRGRLREVVAHGGSTVLSKIRSPVQKPAKTHNALHKRAGSANPYPLIIYFLFSRTSLGSRVQASVPGYPVPTWLDSRYR